MPNTNINKIAAFVILAGTCLITITGCGVLSPQRVATDDAGPYERHEISGKLQSPDLKEASGIAASKCQPDVFWTHNDSGDQALLFAIDSKGSHLGVWKVSGATNRDWEDIASIKQDGKCYVLIGEIGDNDHKHQRFAIYRIEEPIVAAEGKSSNAKAPLTSSNAAVTYIKYPAERHDSEALLAHPSNGDFYLLTKSSNSPSHVYKFTPKFEGEELTMEKVADMTVPAIPNGSITGGDIASDGKHVILCDYFSGYELTLPDGAASFDEIWKQRPTRVDLGRRAIGEAVAYSADGDFVIAVSEKKNTPVNIARRKAANSDTSRE